MLKDHQDAYGHSLYDCLKGTAESQIVERDDGYIEPDRLKGYFDTYKDWHPIEKKAMRYVRGRVLDIGCGAGRHALYLQDKGLEVMGIDNSPLVVKVCRERGLRDARIAPITQIGPRLGVFDTVLMLGNNFGLFGSFEGARRLLAKLSRITSSKGRVVAMTSDTYRTDNPDHLAYHARNRERGRMSGQLRLRVRYKKYAMPWFDYLIVSKDEMESILEGSGWSVNRYIDSDASYYMAIIDKTKR